MKPRLLFVLPDLGVGGAQPMNLRLAGHLVHKGYPVRIVTLFKRFLEPLDAPSVRIEVAFPMWGPKRR